MLLRCGKYRMPIDRPLIMGIVNITPDSFSDGGRFGCAQDAVDHGLRLIEEGADILDLGGESTRPGAAAVDPDEELRRVIPVLEGLAQQGVPVSVDTMKPRVMRAAIEHGASMINDVNALQAPGALEAVGGADVAVCLMHMRGEPRTMQQNPRYADVVAEVKAFLRARLEAAMAAGIAPDRLVVDPGIGFGKILEHNLALMRRLGEFAELQAPLLVGVSRKSMLGQITGRAVAERVSASVAAAIIAVQKGAAIVRVHDVAATRDAFRILQAIEGAS